MSRASRLLSLLQALRRHRRPVTGAALASELRVSLRTVYRDIATLQAQGAAIRGEAGLGFVMKPGYLLPPLMLSEEELEALVLGGQWVAKRADARLGDAARNALAKIAAVLPGELRDGIDVPALLVPGDVEPGERDLPVVRAAIRGERKLFIAYEDGKGARSERTIWPFMLAYFERVRVVAAWCERRRGFRAFRVDRIAKIEPLDDRYPRRRQVLLAEWREREGIPAP
ncbi:MAG: YafY family protein [Anaeromyxobacteraceae bacterium]